MGLGFAPPYVRRGRASFVLRGMLRCISDVPRVCGSGLGAGSQWCQDRPTGGRYEQQNQKMVLSVGGMKQLSGGAALGSGWEGRPEERTRS